VYYRKQVFVSVQIRVLNEREIDYLV
jgi:hypothetical protein